MDGAARVESGEGMGPSERDKADMFVDQLA